jgi:hypothetical protein
VVVPRAVMYSLILSLRVLTYTHNTLIVNLGEKAPGMMGFKVILDTVVVEM